MLHLRIYTRRDALFGSRKKKARAKTGSKFTSSRERGREREREKEMREREREEGRDRREIGTKGERERERERRKDCYQSLLLYDGGARAEGEREGDEPAFSWADSRRLRLKPIKWRVERERKKEGTLTGSC